MEYFGDKNFYDIGDTVEIGNWGNCYSNYKHLAFLMDLKNWKNGYSEYKISQGIIVNKLNHPDFKNAVVYGIRLNNNHEVLIGHSKSLKLISKKPLLPDYLFQM